MDHERTAGAGSPGRSVAVAARDIPITRDMVYQWISSWKGLTTKGQTKDDFPTWMGKKINEMNLPDPFVNTSGHDTLPEQMPIADFLALDLDSYSNYASGS